MEDLFVRLLPYILWALSLYCVVIAIRPRWFRNFRVRVSDADDDPWNNRSVRLGSMSTGTVRAFCSCLAILLAVGGFVVHGWIGDQQTCSEVRALYEDSGGDADAARADARELGYRLQQEELGEHAGTVVHVLRDGREVGRWSTGGWQPGVSCER